MLKFLRRKKARQPVADATIEVAELLTGDGMIRIPMLPRLGTSLSRIDYAAASVIERLVLGALVQREKATRIFEIGTFRGVTALAMAVNAPPGATIWTLDLPPTLDAAAVADKYYSANTGSGFHGLAKEGANREVGAAFREYKGESNVVQLFGDAATFDFSPFTPVDLFFVDGCHFYAEAKRDTLVAKRVLRRGGLIVWHDYTWPTVEKAAREVAGSAITWVNGTSIAFAAMPA